MEIVDLVNLENVVIGTAPRELVRRQNLLHRGVGILVRNTRGEVYVHQRTDSKDVFPSMFDMFVGGMVASGEEYLPAATREVAEELGIQGAPLERLFSHLYQGPDNRAWIEVFEVTWDGPIRHQAEEIQWGTWLPEDQLQAWSESVAVVPDGLEVYHHYLEHRRQHAKWVPA